MTGKWYPSAQILVEALSSTEPTPGGGAAAAIAAAMGCGLGVMACGISLKSMKLDPANRPGLESALAKLSAMRDELLALSVADAASFENFMKAIALPKDDPARPARLQDAAVAAAEVPLSVARTAMDAYREAEKALTLAAGTVTSDIHCCLHLLKAASLCAAENVRINLRIVKDQAKTAELQRRLAAAVGAFAD